MRVLMVNRHFHPFLGGVEFHILNLSRQLVARGCAVTVACRATPGRPAREEFRGLTVRRLGRVAELDALVREGFDVVHAHMPRNLFALAGLAFAKRNGIPTVFTPHCFYPSRRVVPATLKALADRTVTPLTFRLSDVTISLTENDRRDACRRGLATDRSVVFPNCVSTAELAAVPRVDFAAEHGVGGPFLLHVGRFDPVKHVEFLVAAHRHLPELTLVLIGPDGGTLAATRALVGGAGLGDRVRVIERASFADLCGAYAQASALVMASAYEGLPTVILEALFFGAPVIAPAVGGIPHVLTDRRLGVLYPHLDETAYVAAARAVGDGRADAHGDFRRRHVEGSYSWERVADGILDVYRRLMARSPRRAAA
jgi:glycosyltransferase involved in cell wall biosynthesis